MSTAIIPPRTIPRRTAEPPPRPPRKSFIAVLIAAIGMLTASMTNPVKIVPRSGKRRIDLAPSSERGTLTYFLIARTKAPAINPPTRAPRKPDETPARVEVASPPAA